MADAWNARCCSRAFSKLGIETPLGFKPGGGVLQTRPKIASVVDTSGLLVRPDPSSFACIRAELFPRCSQVRVRPSVAFAQATGEPVVNRVDTRSRGFKSGARNHLNLEFACVTGSLNPGSDAFQPCSLTTHQRHVRPFMRVGLVVLVA